MKYYLRRIRLNQGGYDSYGAYWGISAPLYRFEADCDSKSTLYVQDYIRAVGRETAKWKIRAEYGQSSTFFN